MIEIFGTWLWSFTGAHIEVHRMVDVHFVPPRCACGAPADRFVYTVAKKIVLGGYIIPRNRSVAHFFACLPCSKAAGIYIHPGVAPVGRMKIKPEAYGCTIKVLTESPAWG
jgi:hypothetical protein